MITIKLTYDLDKCVHCAQAGVNRAQAGVNRAQAGVNRARAGVNRAQAGVNHKNVSAQQNSKVTSNTHAVHPTAATPFCSVQLLLRRYYKNSENLFKGSFVLLLRDYLDLDKCDLLYQDKGFSIITQA